ncbi:MAG: hypothetical protein Q7S40_27220 [Opitutaceae bacterium]|nr:hypothetical protein [Opitutaceae bacterium]
MPLTGGQKKPKLGFEAGRGFATLTLFDMSVQANPTSSRTEIRPQRWLDSRLALWIAAERLLVLAGLHWGHAARHRARGDLPILPAFSPWTAGTPWNDQLGTTDTLWAISPNRIFMLPARKQPHSAAV